MTDPERPGAQRWVPETGGIPALREAARDCRGCELHGPATQTVFSSGSPIARVVLVGEQPGDQEDRQGAPFVGPAGRLLDKALERAGIARTDAYVTNAVKHFRFTQTPKRRMHRTPELAHVEACRPWLDAELAVLDPLVVVGLGATAARALLGPQVRVTKDRGLLKPRHTGVDEPAGRRTSWWLVTVHPSAVLRADDREGAMDDFVDDLRVVAEALEAEGGR